MTSESGRPEVLALIPARGGSKGIPGKNIVVLAGKPLIAYSIEQAHNSEYITRTIVSTDSEEIAEVARAHGAEVPFMRPDQFAQDLSPDIETFRHALIWLAENQSYYPDLVVHLRPTGPVRRIDLLDESIRTILDDPKADSLRSVSWPSLTPYKMWRSAEGKYIEPVAVAQGIHDSHSMPRQLLPEVLWQNGYVDIVRPDTVLKNNSMAGDHVLPFLVDEPRLELDYPEDLAVVEEALELMAKGEYPTVEGRDDNIVRHPV